MSWHELVLCISPEAPLVLSRLSGSESGNETLDYVPGAALLGALASHAIECGWQTSGPDFRRSFLDGTVSIGNAYPRSETSLPVPRSFVRPKGYSEAKEYAWDAAVAELKSEKLDAVVGNALKLNEIDAKSVKLEDIRRGYIHGSALVSVSNSVRTHTAIEPGQRKAAEGQLFSYEAVEGEKFFAVVRSQDKNLLQTLASLVRDSAVYLGRSRASGYGRARLSIVEQRPYQAVHGTFGEMSILTLTSDVLLPPGISSMEQLLRKSLDDESIEVKKAWAASHSLQAFHGQWGLPRECAMAIAAGSVFLVKLGKVSCGRLAELAPRGIGLRTHEGHGRFALNHPALHAAGVTRDLKSKAVESRAKPPQGDKLPPLTRPGSGLAQVVFDRFLKVRLAEFVEILLGNEDVRKLIDNGDLLGDTPPNSQINALRIAAADGTAKRFLHNQYDRDGQKRKWDDCHVDSHLHHHKQSFGAYVAAFIEGCEQISDRPETSADSWLSDSLKSISPEFSARLRGGLRSNFIRETRTAYLVALLRAVLEARRKADKRNGGRQ